MAERTLNDKKEIHFEYMDYIGICIPNPNDGLRYYGRIYSPDSPDEPMEDELYGPRPHSNLKNSITYSNDVIKRVGGCFTFYLPLSFHLNYFHFGNSCFGF